MKSLDIPPAWEAAARRYLDLGGVTLVLGGTDTGKSTLCQYLIYRAYASGKVSALVDLDLGQSHLGPPAALGLGIFPPRLPGNQGLFPEGLYFIGQTSPVGAVLEVTVGSRVLVDQARAQGVRQVAVNTSGLISGPAAFRLKQAKVDLLQPVLILSLERDQELAPLLRVLKAGHETLRLPVSSRAIRRSLEERRQYRQSRFQGYFAGGRRLAFPLTEISWLGPPFGWGEPLSPEDLRHWGARLGLKVFYGVAGDSRVTLVVDRQSPRPGATEPTEGLHLRSPSDMDYSLTGLWDKHRHTLALGVLLPSPWEEGRLEIYTPLPIARSREVRFLSLGRRKISPTGRELANNYLT
ncbi:MAG: Clp1/GlmU family protein [Desulfobaccales bacterium]